jgi:hypothetical protein
MKTDIRNVRTRWINVDKDEEKARLMVELLNQYEFTDHERFSAVTGIDPHEGVNRGEEHYRNCAESHFKVLEETIMKDGKPVMILEDDVEIEPPAWTAEVPIPEDADAIYFGTSHGDRHYEAIDMNNGWLKIKRVFSTHAILHINKEFSRRVIEEGKNHMPQKFLFSIRQILKILSTNGRVLLEIDSILKRNLAQGLLGDDSPIVI